MKRIKPLEKLFLLSLDTYRKTIYIYVVSTVSVFSIKKQNVLTFTTVTHGFETWAVVVPSLWFDSDHRAGIVERSMLTNNDDRSIIEEGPLYIKFWNWEKKSNLVVLKPKKNYDNDQV